MEKDLGALVDEKTGHEMASWAASREVKGGDSPLLLCVCEDLTSF